jgi:hypothetical protein
MWFVLIILDMVASFAPSSLDGKLCASARWLVASPSNVEVVRRQITSNSHRQLLYRPHQRSVSPPAVRQ